MHPWTVSSIKGLVMKAGTLTPPSCKDPLIPLNGRLPSGAEDPLSDRNMTIVLSQSSLLFNFDIILPIASSTAETIPFRMTFSSNDFCFSFMLPFIFCFCSYNLINLSGAWNGAEAPVNETWMNHGEDFSSFSDKDSSKSTVSFINYFNMWFIW